MSQATAAPPPVSIAAFDRFIATVGGTARYELIAGEIVAMTNPSIAHEVIVGNIGGPLRQHMRARGGYVSQGGVPIQSRADGEGDTKPRPDLIAFCGPVDLQRNFVTNPLAVLDVLSPSNLDHDRGHKLRFYKAALPTLLHVVLVYQDQMRVEHSRRIDTGWDTEVLTSSGAILLLDALEFRLSLAELCAASGLA